jgi:hypothetical protein
VAAHDSLDVDDFDVGDVHQGVDPLHRSPQRQATAEIESGAGRCGDG